MAHELELTTFYQGLEEVLQFSVMYVDTSVAPEIDIELMIELAQEVAANLQAEWDQIFAAGVVLWAVRVSVPRQVASTIGPFQFWWNVNYTSAALAPPMPDAVTQNINIEGVNTDDEPVVGGIRLSGVPNNDVDCSVLSEDQITNLETFMNDTLPPVITLSGGETFTRVIKHKPFTIDEELVIADQTSVPTRSGSRIDRVLNRTQCRTA